MSLRVNQLTGFGGGSGKGPISLSYRTQTIDTGTNTSFSFSSQDIGSASPFRLVVVGILLYGATVSSCTIGGVSATLTAAAGTAASAYSVLAYAVVTSGTTATIVVNTSTSTQGCSISVCSIYNLDSYTPVGTDTDTVQNPSLSASSLAGGVAVAHSGVVTLFGSATCTWDSPMTEHHDTNTTISFYGHSRSMATTTGIAGSTLSFTLTRSTGTSWAASLATWR